MPDDPRTMNIVNPELRGMPERDYREELNRRSHKAGHTTRNGGPVPIKCAIVVPFGKERLNIWARDKHGNLIED